MKKTNGKEDMSFDEWLLYGFTRFWSSAPICATHDGFPDESTDCRHYILVYKNEDEADKAMEEFPPAYWRAQLREGMTWED